MFVGDKNENINFKNMACQCDDAIPGSFARAVGNLGTSLSNRAHRENFRHKKLCLHKQTLYDNNIVSMNSWRI